MQGISKTNQNDYDFSGVMADFGLPEKYYTCEVNTQGFMVTNRADTISDSGKLPIYARTAGLMFLTSAL